jgi:hypothetical protein
VNDGGRVLVGGRALPGEGYFYEPTVIEMVPLENAGGATMIIDLQPAVVESGCGRIDPQI